MCKEVFGVGVVDIGLPLFLILRKTGVFKIVYKKVFIIIKKYKFLS